MTRLLIPPMTTVAQDKAVMARDAVALLLKVLDGKEEEPVERQAIRVPPHLIVRGSTAPPSEARPTALLRARRAPSVPKKGPLPPSR